jgi:hypothetical protein
VCHKPSYSNTEYQGMVPQDSVYLALSTYQPGNSYKLCSCVCLEGGGSTEAEREHFYIKYGIMISETSSYVIK